jgi:hypothetical protein
MSITAYTTVTADITDPERLAVNVAAAIDDGYQPSGPVVVAADKLVQIMVQEDGVATVYTADGAIATNSGIKVISKTSAAAMTLAAPAADGDEITLIAGTAFAHVITATDLIDDGVTGGAKDTITLGAFVGACATLVAYNGHWVLKSKTVATVA